ncbi:MAG: hypothetical protein HYV32_02105 [Candidatus Kerfeldbacteria bacterium]|nr:hypothetical protein [Candidatus Kerfeldbacteria bacterium]
MAIAIGERIPLGWFPELKFTFFLTENVKREREEKDNAWIVEGHPYKLIYTVTSDFDYQDQMCNDRRLRYVFIYSDRGVVTYFPTIKEWEVESDEYGERMKEEMKKIFSIEEEV